MRGLSGYKRCSDCVRPICQRVLTLRGCKQKSDEEVIGVSLNEYRMHDLYIG